MAIDENTVDGGHTADPSPYLTCISYKTMEPVRNALLKNMQAQIDGAPGMGSGRTLSVTRMA